MKKYISLFLLNVMFLCSVSCENVNNQNISNSSDISDISENQNNLTNSEETETETVIRFAAANNNDYINEAIEQFNEADNGYFIEVAEYDHTLDDSDDSLNLTDFDLIQNIINKNNIDFVVNWAFAEEANYKNLQQKGAFTDIYKFMENDEEINKNTLNSHILQLNEVNGELYSIPTFYTAYTLAGNPEYVGTKPNQTIDELIDHWEKMPENATISGSKTKESVYYTLLRDNLELFVDYENGIVNFDSEDFRKTLEFCNSFEYNDRQKTEYDYNAPDFCYECRIFSFMNIALLNIGSANPEITFIGYPDSDRKGAYLRSYSDSFSICAGSDENKQKGAWEFIRTFFTEEWQEENALSYSDPSKSYASQNAFCMNNQANENIKNNTVNKKYSPPTFESKGETITVQFPSLEDCNALEKYINNINRWEISSSDNISNIVEDEVFAYFADEISIDECIDHIQNRSSIWISEIS